MPCDSFKSARPLGFSLLEVLFAVALFGAVVTFILSAAGGAHRGQHTGRQHEPGDGARALPHAGGGREGTQARLPRGRGEGHETAAAKRRRRPALLCDWNVERVKLPEVTSLGGDAGIDVRARRKPRFSARRRVSPPAAFRRSSRTRSSRIQSRRALDLDAGLHAHGQHARPVVRRRGRAGPLVDGLLLRLPVAQAAPRGGDPAGDRRRPLEGRDQRPRLHADAVHHQSLPRGPLSVGRRRRLRGRGRGAAASGAAASPLSPLGGAMGH